MYLRVKRLGKKLYQKRYPLFVTRKQLIKNGKLEIILSLSKNALCYLNYHLSIKVHYQKCDNYTKFAITSVHTIKKNVAMDL